MLSKLKDIKNIELSYSTIVIGLVGILIAGIFINGLINYLKGFYKTFTVIFVIIIVIALGIVGFSYMNDTDGKLSLSEAGENVMQLFDEDKQERIEKMVDTLSTPVQSIKNAVKGAVSDMQELSKDGIHVDTKGIAKTVKGVATKVGDGVKTIVQNVTNAADGK